MGAGVERSLSGGCRYRRGAGLAKYSVTRSFRGGRRATALRSCAARPRCAPRNWRSSLVRNFCPVRSSVPTGTLTLGGRGRMRARWPGCRRRREGERARSVARAAGGSGSRPLSIDDCAGRAVPSASACAWPRTRAGTPRRRGVLAHRYMNRGPWRLRQASSGCISARASNYLRALVHRPPVEAHRPLRSPRSSPAAPWRFIFSARLLMNASSVVDAMSVGARMGHGIDGMRVGMGKRVPMPGKEELLD